MSDLRVGGSIGRLDADVEVGDPGLPKLTGKETVVEAVWRYDGQDSPVVPSGGSQVFAVGLTQLSGQASRFWSMCQRGRLFVVGGLGTSFDNRPLPTDQFALGAPLHLGAYSQGEIRGDHYYVATAGYLHRFGRLPDFMGGPIYAGGWLENGDAFDTWGDATVRTHASVGLIMDTLVGPVILGGSAGFDGRWRTYLGVGRVFTPRW